MAKTTWRETVLRHVWAEHELHPDQLHEASEGEADLLEAESAVAALVAEGVLHEAQDGLITCAVGQESWLSTLVTATSPRPPHPNRA